MHPPIRPEDGQSIPGGTHFLIRIQYQQNNSWQGTIQWLDNRKIIPFRSTLEMILLMEEALVLHAGKDQQQSQFRHWNRETEIG
ncbi:hypothetical protein [Anoxynatronum buryatiense]|uniref:Uncharacterized protein n=1 Tax=Anoxynatronum buryatiense TaxID=489973 RepID=A0AA45WYQ7_9CLOT|nr:hypothetical protein [Anoxynatronum buryatiense]SMP67988.1 hypothetical protein SAMN06296020_11632 [Anoxynatronum buryatiense]